MGTAHGAGSAKQLLTALLLLLVAMIILMEVTGLALFQGATSDAGEFAVVPALSAIEDREEEWGGTPDSDLIGGKQPNGGRRPENASRAFTATEELKEGKDPASSGTLKGRLIDPLGQPLVGVELVVVTVYPEWTSLGSRMHAQPVGDSVLSDDAGSFQFEGLGRSSYEVRVNDSEWIVLPRRPSSWEIRRVRLRAGETVDVGDLVVVPVDTLRVHVVGRDGAPPSKAMVKLEPIAIEFPGVAATEEGNSFDRWLSGEDRASAYRPSEIAYTASSFQSVRLEAANPGALSDLSPDGNALLRVARGTWKLLVNVDLGRATGLVNVHEQVVTLPRGPLEIELPIASVSIAGIALDHDGHPLANVQVVALINKETLLDGPKTRTDAQGVFRFRLLSVDEPRWLYFSEGGVLVTTRDIEPVEAGAASGATTPGKLPTYRLLRSANLTIALNTTGKIPAVAPLHIRALHLDDPGKQNSDLGWSVEELELARELRLIESTSDAVQEGERELVVNDLLPGTYEVSLWLGHGTGDFFMATGRPVLDMRLWQKSTFITGVSDQVFEINFKGYEEPARQPSERVEFQVKNAASGALVPQAWIALSGDQWSRSGWSNTKGLCAFHIPDLPFTAKVSQSGFGYQTKSFDAPSGIPSRIGLELQPTKSVVSFTLQSKFGESIPEVYLRFFDEDDQSVLGRLEGKREWRDGGFLQAPHPLVLLDIPAGRLRVEVTIGKVSFGSLWTEIQGTGELQESALVLGETLEEVRAKIRDARE
ncbi:MAG: hypothetical protein ACI8PQ_000413 [Planctomycetota bacterium]|jgi:hypothetical protein